MCFYCFITNSFLVGEDEDRKILFVQHVQRLHKN